MESRHENVELIDEAIKKLLKERRNRGASGERYIQSDDDKDEHLLLSRLLSQLETLKGDCEEIQEAEQQGEGEATATSEVVKSKNGGDEEFDKEEIVKELKNLKRQNSITHWLLSVMIVLTIAWQASEVTLLWRVKQGLSNPFSYVGSLVGSLFSRGSDQNGHDEKQNKSDAFPNLKMPELPDVGLTDLKHGGSGNHEMCLVD